MQQLAEKFPRERLIEAGVIEPDSDQALALDSRLANGEGPFIFLRRCNGQFFDIVAPDGTCLSGACPLFAIASDRMTSFGSTVLGVSSMADVALLRAVGKAGAPLTDLAGLNASGLRRLMKLVGAESSSRLTRCSFHFRTDLFEDYTTPFYPIERFAKIHLSIVAGAFNEPTPSQTQRLCAVVQHLKQSSLYLGIRWNNINVWWPEGSATEELAFHRRLKSPELLEEFFDKNHPTYPLDDIESGDGPPALPSPAEALEEALREIVSSGHFRSSLCARREYAQSEIRSVGPTARIFRIVIPTAARRLIRGPPTAS